MEDLENMDWEELPPLPDVAAEMKKIRRSLRKRNFLIVCTCLILVAALAFGIIQYGIPALEQRYWDPNTSTYLEDTTDLELTLAAYTELFCPGYSIFSVESIKSGFATHSITVTFNYWNDYDKRLGITQQAAVLSKNELTFPVGFWDACTDDYLNTVGEGGLDYMASRTLSALREYPDYVHVLARVHFPEDLDTEEAISFCYTTDYRGSGRPIKYNVIWFNIRNSEKGEHLFPKCGFDPNFYGPSDWRLDSEYPYLDGYSGTASIDDHFMSMLRFLQDQLDKGTGFLPPDCSSESYYTDSLNYVEENGVMSYEAYVMGTPDALSQRYEKGAIDGILLCDAWISY